MSTGVRRWATCLPPTRTTPPPAAFPGFCRTGPSCALLPVKALGSRSAGQGLRPHAPPRPQGHTRRAPRVPHR